MAESFDQNTTQRFSLDRMHQNNPATPEQYAKENDIDYERTFLASIDDGNLRVYMTGEGPYLVNEIRREGYNFVGTKSGLEEAAHKLASNDSSLYEDMAEQDIEPIEDPEFKGGPDSNVRIREISFEGNKFVIYDDENPEAWIDTEDPVDLGEKR